MQKLIPALLLAVLALVSCGKDDDTAAKNPTWVVSSYSIQEPSSAVPTDKTSLFSGYTFEFNNDNSVVINKPDGSTALAKRIIDATASTASLSMNSPFAPMDDILGDWQLVASSDTDLKLERALSNTTFPPQQPAKLHFQKQ